MSCCNCHRNKPSQNDLTNLEYVELLSKIDDKRIHAKEHHSKEQWKCKYLFHDWDQFDDPKDNGHEVCHRCGKYRPYREPYRSPTYLMGY